MRVGFVGTGHMGNPMARHLIRGGNELTVFDRRPEAAANLIELGARWADSAAGVASQTEVVFTSLPGPPEVDEAVLGEEGILAGAKPGLIHVDLSSNLPGSVRRLHGIEASRGVTFLDAPVSGMVVGAEAGTLAVFVGGDAKAFEVVQPLLNTFGGNVFHVGGVGLGNIVKLSNNLMVIATGLLVHEALAMGVKAGIPAQKLYEMWNVSSSSRYVQGVPRLLERQFDNPTFALALAAKDVGLAVEAGRELAVAMPLTAAASQVYTRAIARGLGGLSPQAVLQSVEQDSGVEVK
jgi:3-hydroxyisobutyrate dehydrogenase-like beta-hydroxyacid dehydrogenase